MASKPKYPRTVGYLSFIRPLETLPSGNFTPNFYHHTTSVGFPIGVNVLYSGHFGFSYEFTPTVEASDGNSKMSNLLFDPGTMFRFDHDIPSLPVLPLRPQEGMVLHLYSTRFTQELRM